MLIDTHVHLDKFDDSDITPIMDRAADVGVGFVISAGTTIKSTKRCINLSVNHPNFFSGVGVHPMDLEAPLNDGDYETLRDLALSSDKVVVMSENSGRHDEATYNAHNRHRKKNDRTKIQCYTCWVLDLGRMLEVFMVQRVVDV